MPLLSGDTTTQTVAVIKQDETPSARYQVVTQGSSETAPTVIKTFQTQGDVTCWLAVNGYQWVSGSANPQLWVK